MHYVWKGHKTPGHRSMIQFLWWIAPESDGCTNFEMVNMFFDENFFYDPGWRQTVVKHISASWNWVPDNTVWRTFPFLWSLLLHHYTQPQKQRWETWIRATCLILTVNIAFNGLSDVDFYSFTVIMFSSQSNPFFPTKILFPFIPTLLTLMD